MPLGVSACYLLWDMDLPCKFPLSPSSTPIFGLLWNDVNGRLLLSLEKNHALPFPYFQDMTELKFFPLFCGATTVLMGCLIPTVDYCYDKYIEDQRRRQRTKSEESEAGDSDRRLLWESAEWSMPMRYIGGVIGFAWAASVLSPPFVLPHPFCLCCPLRRICDSTDE